MIHKNIFFIVLNLKIGGIEMITTNLANALVKRGYNVKILCLVNNNDLKNRLDTQIEVENIGKRPQSDSIFYKIYWRILIIKLVCLLSKIHNSIIISTRDEYNILVSQFASKDNLRIAQLHHDYIGKRNLISHFKYYYSNIDVFAILTQDVKEELKTLMRPYNKTTQFRVVPNFLPDNSEIVLLPEEEAILNLYSGKEYCIAVGRLEQEKGFDRLIKVWKIIKNKKVNLHLLIVGNGSLKDDLLNTINEEGLSENIFLLGSLSNNLAQQLMKYAKCYCMSSYSEGCPIVLIEALSQGTPQVAFDVRVGPRNIIRDGETGFLIKDSDIDSYADAVIKISSDLDLRKKFSSGSLMRAVEYSEPSVLSKWEQIFQQQL